MIAYEDQMHSSFMEVQPQNKIAKRVTNREKRNQMLATKFFQKMNGLDTRKNAESWK